MQNINVREDTERGVLHVEIDLKQPGELSESGKSYIVAKTGGWAPLREVAKGEYALNLGLIRKTKGGAWRETRGVA